MATAVDDGTEQISEWLRANVGGKVVRINRQPRWRPVWFADVERDGELLELCVRGDRTDMPLIFPLDHEMRLQATMRPSALWNWPESHTMAASRPLDSGGLRCSQPRQNSMNGSGPVLIER